MLTNEEIGLVMLGGLFGLWLLVYPKGFQKLLLFVHELAPNSWWWGRVEKSQFRIRSSLVRVFGSLFVLVASWSLLNAYAN